jgi:translation elongation factor EF-G
MRIRVQIAEPILGDVINELTRIGASVHDLKNESGTCTLTAMADAEQVPGFERWLSIFSKGAVRMETLTE